MPYDSITGTLKTSSNPAITGGGKAADDERMNRSELRTGRIGRLWAWAKMA